MSDSSQPHGLRPTKLLRLWDFPGKSTGVGCHCLLQNSIITIKYLDVCLRKIFRKKIVIVDLIAQLIRNLLAMQETLVQFWVGKIHWRRDQLPSPVFLGFPCGSAGKESTCNGGDLGWIPGLGRSLGEGKGCPL